MLFVEKNPDPGAVRCFDYSFLGRLQRPSTGCARCLPNTVCGGRHKQFAFSECLPRTVCGGRHKWFDFNRECLPRIVCGGRHKQ